MSKNISEIADSDFETKVLKADGLVLVDFWAPWCGPCKAIAPVLEEIATQFADKLTIVKVNVDDNPKNAAEFQVRGIPNLIFFKNGEKVDQLVGAVPKDDLVKAVESLV